VSNSYQKEESKNLKLGYGQVVYYFKNTEPYNFFYT